MVISIPVCLPTAKYTHYVLICTKVVPVHLSNQDFQLYYSKLPPDLLRFYIISVNLDGCCNATFWPLFHSMPDRAVFEEEYWDAYRQINHRSAVQ